MASRNTRKTWETAFLLSASMSSSYQETFDKARNIMHELGAENIQLGDEAERAAQRQENAFNLMASALAEAGLFELLGRIKDAYAEIIEVTEEFEYTVSAVQAISDAGAEDVAKLEAKARDLGETTVYTARQSAEAMTFMAQAGWDTVEMLEGMDGVIALAAASGTDLAETSSIVADTLSGFGMSADETTRLADVLAQTASHTNTNVSLMGNTFQNAAAIAGALGFSIEDVSVMLGIMANAGVKGSRAGTSLRNIFNGLAKDATLTAEAFGEVNFSMFDDEGKSKRLIDVVRELRGYFSQMTDQEKYLNASGLAGLRGYNALLAVIGATDEQFEELYEDIQNAGGAAKRMADIRLDNLKGDVTLLNSALESLTITYGEHLMPAGRDLTQWLTEVVQRENELLEAHPKIVTGINAIVGALGGALAMVTAVSAAIKLKSIFLMLTELFTPGGWLVVGIGAAIGLFAALAVHFAELDAQAEELYADQMRAAKQIQDNAEAYRESAKAWRESMDAMDDEAGNTDYLIDRLDNLYSVQDKTLAQKQEILAIVELLNEAVPELALAYDQEADSLNLTAEAIRERARAEVEAEQMAERQAQLKERIKQENALNADVEKAAELYKNAKADYDRVYAEEMASQSKWMGRDSAEKSMAYNRNVKAAKEAMDEAQAALQNAVTSQKDNQWWIDELSRQISGEERGSGRSTGGGGTPEQYSVWNAELAARKYTENLAELNSRLAQRTMLAQNLSSAQQRYDEAGAWWQDTMADTAEARALYDRYEADTGTINRGMEREAAERSDRLTTISRDIYNAATDIREAQAAIDENEAAIAELSAAVAGYEGARPETPGAEGYTVTVENNITITGSVDEDTIEQMQEISEEVVERAFKKTLGMRSRNAYDGGY